MSARGWRNLCFVLAVVSGVQLWRDCGGGGETPRAERDCRPEMTAGASRRSAAERVGRGAKSAGADVGVGVGDDGQAVEPPEPATGGGLNIAGFMVPSWAMWMAPHPGEDLRSYRDRMLPLAQAAIAPQRARVARSRDAFAQTAGLDDHQRAELDAAAHETAAAIEDRVMSAVIGGELMPATFKPMTGVSVARELLDIVARGNQRFVAGLRDDQRAKLAQHPFDFGDYLVFATPWEDALKFLD
ncbi:MAG TPA: hypothetical protein VLM79_01565 [Kofleriaceae bacterium]|nr:hypothetical protein [Kofleriaceae bacterium]